MAEEGSQKYLNMRKTLCAFAGFYDGGNHGPRNADSL